MLNQDITKSIELKLAEARSLAEQVDESVTLLYLIDMTVSEARSFSSDRVFAKSNRENSPSRLLRPPKLQLVR